MIPFFAFFPFFFPTANKQKKHWKDRKVRKYLNSLDKVCVNVMNV